MDNTARNYDLLKLEVANGGNFRCPFDREILENEWERTDRANELLVEISKTIY